eukprot:scaffold104_cov375-Prasinococcus_capsulatus_cf.AAC.33
MTLYLVAVEGAGVNRKQGGNAMGTSEQQVILLLAELRSVARLSLGPDMDVIGRTACSQENASRTSAVDVTSSQQQPKTQKKASRQGSDDSNNAGTGDGGDKKGKKKRELFAGAAFANSPPPSSVPWPSFLDQ